MSRYVGSDATYSASIFFVFIENFGVLAKHLQRHLDVGDDLLHPMICLVEALKYPIFIDCFRFISKRHQKAVLSFEIHRGEADLEDLVLTHLFYFSGRLAQLCRRVHHAVELFGGSNHAVEHAAVSFILSFLVNTIE